MGPSATRPLPAPPPPNATRVPWGALALAVALLGCTGGDGGATHERPASASAVPDTLRYTMHTVRRAEGDCRRPDADSAAVPCVAVELTYPLLDSTTATPLADSVRAHVRRTAFTQFDDSVAAPDGETAAAAFVAAYRAAHREMPGRQQLWSRVERVSVACNGPDVVGLRAEGDQYTGGAHPISFAFLASFDARTAERLRASTFFLPDSLPAVTAAAERAFRREREIPPAQSLADAGFIFFEGGRFTLPGEMLVCPDSVTFHFNPYDVGPYVLGPTTFALPMTEVAGWLRPRR
ncbi:MAG TPA: DUF3298 domain-containing protein [Gemmatimonadaceae bacterium]